MAGPRRMVQSKNPAPASAARKELAALRRAIDALDARIVGLINQRAATAQKIGALKAREGISPYHPARESQVYRQVAAQNAGPLPQAAFRAIYREIMAASLALEQLEWQSGNLAAAEKQKAKKACGCTCSPHKRRP